MTRKRPPHLRILQPHAGVFAYYDGRVAGYRFLDGPNWVDDGAIALGIATYAIVSGSQALVYDTHVSLDHGAAIRAHLHDLGVRDITIVYSHWHLDHIAGTGAFSDCPVIANSRTAQHLTQRHAGIEAGTESGLPAIAPLVLPTRTFDGQMELQLGARKVVLIEANIHSDDATVLWLPDADILLAGDTVEDCVTYVAEPSDFATHLADLDRLAVLGARHVLPDHGSETIIARGGYSNEIIPATQRYIRWLMDLRDSPERADTPVFDILRDDLDSGVLHWFAPYQRIHDQNVARTLEWYGHA
ncbi:MBL fold metallo-hydrolase [Sulfitobacter sp. JL08]|uniref:MBL fold metallo-hydrolase n=1 Tax=Sulfitobacter sp. JL08 TaxID=2070369 RepID=UPI000E0B1A5C|nr:MBL fold metallo-hydrolase [Sulfitobacter sp. JL08]AXI55297.1 MBL fold metallo-hydrolase [Sulfitobacter sp. JL08]